LTPARFSIPTRIAQNILTWKCYLLTGPKNQTGYQADEFGSQRVEDRRGRR
jgi:hypothetical protein